MKITVSKKVLGSKLLDEILAALPEFAPSATPGAVVGLPESQVGVSATDAQVFVTLPDTATAAQIAAVNSAITAHTPTPPTPDPDLTLPDTIKNKVKNDKDLTPKELRQAVKHVLKRLGGL